MVSRYKQFYKKSVVIPNNIDWESFNHFVKAFKDLPVTIQTLKFYSYPKILKSSNVEPFFKVRYENYFNDLMSLDFIRNNQHLFPNEVDRLHKGKDGWVENSLFDSSIPYHKYYDQETADIVWEMFEDVFIYDGYDRESWKTITI